MRNLRWIAFTSQVLSAEEPVSGAVFFSHCPSRLQLALLRVARSALKTSEVKEMMNKQGLEPRTNAPEEFAKFISDSVVQNAKLIKLAGVQIE